MYERSIRPLALGIITKGDQFLMTEFIDKRNNELLYRPAGGGIEFGEFGQQAVVREYQEELGTELRDVRYLGLIENMFTFEGRSGHEIVLVYEAIFSDPSLYDQEAMTGSEADGTPIRAVWKTLAELENSVGRLVPTGLRELLQTTYGR